jgi:hypothetical protein
MAPGVQEFLRQLAPVTDVNRAWDRTRQFVEHGDRAFLISLASELLTAAAHAEPQDAWKYDGVLDELLRQLARAPGAVPLEVAFALAPLLGAPSAGADVRPPGRLRVLAAMLASFRTADEIRATLDGHPSDDPATEDLAAMTLQELVLRGASFEPDPAACALWQSLAARAHPLARLPLRLTELESNLPLTRYAPDGRSSSHAGAGPSGLGRSFPSASGEGRWFEELSAGLDTAAAAMPFEGWTAHSNGESVARLYRATDPLNASGPRLLARVVGEMLDVQGNVHIGVETAASVFAQLFAAGEGGGAYGGSLLGAYARLAAWTSLGALTAAQPPAGVEPVLQAAHGCEWFSFDCDWFQHIAWDVGVAALRPDGRTFAVLAATDTD